MAPGLWQIAVGRWRASEGAEKPGRTHVAFQTDDG